MRRLLRAGFAAAVTALELAAWVVGLRGFPFEGWRKRNKRNHGENS